MNDIKKAAALQRQRDNILILTHLRPDGDTTGCAAGLCAMLRQIGKTGNGSGIRKPESFFSVCMIWPKNNRPIINMQDLRFVIRQSILKLGTIRSNTK